MTGLIGTASEKNMWKSATRSNALFLSTAVMLNNEQLRPIYEWLSETLGLISPGDSLSLVHSHSLCRRPESRRAVLSFLKTADIDVGDIVVEEDKGRDEDDLSQDVGDRHWLQRFRLPPVHFAYQLKDQSKQLLEWETESDGTRSCLLMQVQ